MTPVRTTGHTYFAKFDATAEVWELFCSDDGSDYIGAFDTIGEARRYACQHDAEARS